MRYVVLIAGLLVIAATSTVRELRSRRKKADTELLRFAETVPAPLTPAVRQWLGPQLVRLASYPVIGGVWGLVAATVVVQPERDALPWYWFAALAGAGAGTLAGILLAGYRTEPLVDGPQRTVDPVRRGPGDFLDRRRLLMLRLALVVSVAAFVVVVAVAGTIGPASTWRGLLACGLGVVLVVAHQRVVSTIVARPMVTSSPEGLVWQRALVVRTIEEMPRSAAAVAAFSAVIAVLTLVTAP